MIRITTYAGPPLHPNDVRGGTIKDWTEDGPEEALRKIGLEYRVADYFPNRQVVIVLEPVEDQSELEQIRQRVRTASEALENTGLL
jgi:2'-5' RNA ligase